MKDEVEEHFQTHFPLVEPGAEPPPQRVPDPEHELGHRWSGFFGWRRRHGPAIVAYDDRGHPVRVWSARYPDGSRGDVQVMGGFRRRGPAGKRWVYGSLDIGAGDAVFTDGEQPPPYVPPPPSDEPNLEADLARDPAFLASIQDDRFARAVYTAFEHRTFQKGSYERGWGLGGPRLGALISNLRGLGENYLDYYPEGGLPGAWPDGELPRDHDQTENTDVFAAVYGHLTRLGWQTENQDDGKRKAARARERTLAVLREIEVLEGRTKAEREPWANALEERRRIEPPGRRTARPVRYLRTELLDGMSADEKAIASGDVPRRLDDLALSGRVSQAEYDALSGRLRD